MYLFYDYSTTGGGIKEEKIFKIFKFAFDMLATIPIALQILVILTINDN